MYYRTAFHAIVDTDIDPWEDIAILTDTRVAITVYSHTASQHQAYRETRCAEIWKICTRLVTDGHKSQRIPFYHNPVRHYEEHVLYLT